MMSPQASFAYNYGYGFSPRRSGSQKKRQNKSVGVPVEKDGRNDVPEVGNVQAASITPPRTNANKIRESPATVETTDESESLS
jgi:hypothetical protein